jgi:uncharacterized delta-60 repeat protein
MANTSPTFTVGYGKLSTDFGGKEDKGCSLAIQSDGKLLIGGRSDNGSNYDFALARYGADGSLDTSFSCDGKLTTAFGAGDDSGSSVAIQADGKILVAGYSYNGSTSDFALARYNADGSLDTTFSGDGKLTTALGSGSSVAIQADGKILVSGSSSNGSNADFALVRYNPDGSLDTSFDGDGKLTTDISSGDEFASDVAVQADGKMLIAGSRFNGTDYDIALIRYNTDGTLDVGFDADGKVTTVLGSSYDIGSGVVVQTDGKILVAGSSYNGSNYDFALVRYNADGSLDTSFSDDGKLTTAIGPSDDSGRGIALQADGKILVAGESWVEGNNYDFTLARYNSDGSIDSTFGVDGIATTNIRSAGASDYACSVSVLADGKILVVGTSDVGFGADFALARFNADGSIDTSFGATYSLGGTVAFTEDGPSVVLDSNINIGDAELDSLNGGAGNYAGAFVTLARHGGASTADAFGFTAAGANFNVSGSSLLSGGQVFGTYGQSGGTLSILFTSSGTAATNALVDNVLEHITYSNASSAPPASVQIDWTMGDGNSGSQGTGGPLSVTGSTTVNIAAVNDANTAPDFSTLPPGIVTTPIGSSRDDAHGIALQTDGKILVVGRSYNGSDYDFAIVRYNADGSLDNSFSSDGKLTTEIGSSNDYANSVTVQADGKILVAGQSYSGSSGSGLVLAGFGGNTPNWDMALVRYNADGSLDGTFSGDGKLATTFGGNSDFGRSVAVQTDGKILVAGSTGSSDGNFALVRYAVDGSFDTGFGAGGGVVTDIGTGSIDDGNSLVVQADGKILVAGSSASGGNDDFALVRYNANGSLDTSFSGDGKLLTAIGSGSDLGVSLALQSDGRILVAGRSNNGSDDDFAVVRYNADGSLDTSFGGDGTVTTAVGGGNDLASSLALQMDGKILAAGSSWNGSAYDVALVRYNTDGSLDSGFSGDGILTTAVSVADDYGYSIVVQADGKIVVAGQSYKTSSPYSDSDFAVIRYNSDGSLDSSFEASPTAGTVPCYTEGGVPVVLDSSLALNDRELDALNAGAGDYAGASVTVGRHGGGNVDDEFGFAASGSGFSVLGNELQSGGQTFGTYSQAGGVATVIFSSDSTTATRALVLDVLEHLTYANAGCSPPASVQIDWTFSDGNTGAQGSGGALAVIGSTTVSITNVNDAPTGTVGVDGTAPKAKH